MAEPTFTLIVPSYNGGDYLKECIHSLLAQEYDGFEVAVLDDGSTDGSLQWLQSINDPHLKLYPAQHLGIVGNWGRAVQLPKLEFLTIVGQDDQLDANYCRVMARLIKRHPDAGLYHAHFRFIDKKGKLIRACGPLPERETAAEYISALYARNRDTYGTGYLMRSARYDAIGGIPHYEKLLYADDALWITMMHRSYKAIAPEECFSCRLHSTSTGASAPWQSWLAGMKEYIPFLKRIASEDPAFAAALQKYAPFYFMHNCRALYLLANVQATKQNKRVDPDVADQLAAVLAEIAPEEVPKLYEFEATKSYRMRDLINKSMPLRLLYNLYILTRHGEWKGRPVSR